MFEQLLITLNSAEFFFQFFLEENCQVCDRASDLSGTALLLHIHLYVLYRS